MKEEEKLKTAGRLVNKGLLYNPSFHPLYALKGDIQLLQGLESQYNKYKSKFILETELSYYMLYICTYIKYLVCCWQIN